MFIADNILNVLLYTVHLYAQSYLLPASLCFTCHASFPVKGCTKTDEEINTELHVAATEVQNIKMK